MKPSPLAQSILQYFTEATKKAVEEHQANRPALEELALKYGGKPIEGFTDCWSFISNRDCRYWAEEAAQYGYEVFRSLNVGGAQNGSA